VADIHYAVDMRGLDPSVRSVSFTLAPDDARTVWVEFRRSDGSVLSSNYRDCSEARGTWTCSDPDPADEAPILGIGRLEVTAAQ